MCSPGPPHQAGWREGEQWACRSCQEASAIHELPHGQTPGMSWKRGARPILTCYGYCSTIVLLIQASDCGEREDIKEREETLRSQDRWGREILTDQKSDSIGRVKIGFLCGDLWYSQISKVLETSNVSSIASSDIFSPVTCSPSSNKWILSNELLGCGGMKGPLIFLLWCDNIDLIHLMGELENELENAACASNSKRKN